MAKVNPKRTQYLNEIEYTNGAVCYWMSRDQRVHQNWALLFAQQKAREHNVPLVVVFTLVPKFLDATLRHYDFMLRGLQEVEEELSKKNIPFYVLSAKDPGHEIQNFTKQYDIGLLVCDNTVLNIRNMWQKEARERLDIPVWSVDAHNVVPVWEASDKQEYAARTIRPKIGKQLDEFMDDVPYVQKQETQWKHKAPSIQWDSLYDSLKVDTSVPPVEWITAGEAAAKRVVRNFIEKSLCGYSEHSNDPANDHQSGLSPYLHFGQLSSQYVVQKIEESSAPRAHKDGFLEELIVRRELAENFCYYNKHYASFAGFPNWAKESLKKHTDDEREYVYTKDEFESAKTHDDLWNAAQMQMVNTGKMHGYMRMYWAKKILEWTNTPQYAMQVAVYLNDKYELDGRDPNGYVGCAWSIGGLHDQGWKERPVYGKVRYMSRKGMERKFDTKRYINDNLDLS